MSQETINHPSDSPREQSKQTTPDTNTIERGSMDAFTTRFSVALSEKLDQKDIHLDTRVFKARITEMVERVLLNPSIPSVAKEKFRQDLMMKLDLFAQVDASDVNFLKNRQNTESLGTRYLELYGKTDEEKQRYFLGKILDETIIKQIEPMVYSLEQSFSTETVPHPSLPEVSYNQTNYTTFVSDMKRADDTLGLRVFDRAISPLSQKIDISRMNFKPDIGKTLMMELAEHGYKISDPHYFKSLIQRTSALGGGSIHNSDKRAGTAIVDREGKPVMKEGKPLDGVNLLVQYLDGVDKFQWVEGEMYATKEAATDTWLLSGTKEVLGMNQLKSEFDHLKPDTIEAKMKNASFADMVIMMTQFTQLPPGIGDMIGGVGSSIDAMSGMTVDGEKLDALDRSLAGIFWVLGITVVGGFALRAHKAGKLAEIIKSLSVITKYLPEKFDAFMKTGAKLSEDVKAVILQFGKMMGEATYMKMEKMMAKHGMVMYAVEPGVKKAKEFITEWKSDEKIYKELQQYYNPTRPILNHPKAEEIATELSIIRNRMKQDKNVRTDLEALAKDPEAYLAKKAAGKDKVTPHRAAERTKKTPHEEFLENLEKYKQLFSESNLKSLEKSDSKLFAVVLLQKRAIEAISALAKTDPARAMTEFSTFMNNPDQYIAKKFPESTASSGILDPEMIQKIKDYTSEKIRTFREYFTNTATPNTWDMSSYQEIAKKIGGINIPLPTGQIIGTKDFRIIWGKNDEFLDIIWTDKKTGEHIGQRIPRKDFEAKNPHLFENSSGRNESHQAETPNTKNAPRRNTAYRQWNEVPRAKEIISVGDLHGSYRALEMNLQKAGAINSEGKWIGGNREIVFHGDILADRNTDGFHIFKRIRELQEEAKKEGGGITVLAGNHDDFAFAFLSQKDLPLDWRWVPSEVYIKNGSQALGISEFKKFWSSPQEILMNMRKNPEGRRILEDMCSMKLAENIDDTLFIHVVPNENMLSTIAKNWVDNINKIYQQGMRFHLLGEWTEPSGFNFLRQAFLDTEHRTINGGPSIYQSLRNMGINHIIHWHDTGNAWVSINQYGVRITGNDFWFEKQAWVNGGNPSFIKVEKNGNFKYGNGKSMGH